MPCTVPKNKRAEYVQRLVLTYFIDSEKPNTVITLDTSLGKFGLGHTMVRRKLYFGDISRRLTVEGCIMRSLKPNDFTDVKYRSIGDIADAVLKDLA